MKAELLSGDADELVVRASTPGRSNWLVQVKFEDLSFWANVKSTSPCASGGYEWTMKPFRARERRRERNGAVITRELDQAA